MTNEAKFVRRHQAKDLKWERAYEVHCKTSDLHYDETTKNYWGDMEGVTGTIFQNDQPVANFSADGGEADKATSRLALKGHVTVLALQAGEAGTTSEPRLSEGGEVLTCDKLEWLAAAKILKGRENVSIKSKRGRLGPMDELWSTPDMKRVATPDLFLK